jgi:60 kDa SS-A/Ro ribonucleoprotein
MPWAFYIHGGEMRTNKRATDHRVDKSTRLAGGYGGYAARQDAEALLRRAVMACLLWENLAYEKGTDGAANIAALVPQVAPEIAAAIAVEARTKQKLRHVPLLIAREMARHRGHKALVGDLLPQIILRPDELTEFVAIYWKDGKQPLSKQVKLGLGRAFSRFSEYRLAKWNRKDAEIKLRDVLFLSHARPPQGKAELYRKIADNELATPDTWEVALSAGADKKATWERLITDGKLGGMAFLRNLRNMEAAHVDPTVIKVGFDTVNPAWLLPLDYVRAAAASPRYERQIEGLMLRGLGMAEKLPGHTVFVVDVSGSMGAMVSAKSKFNRLSAAQAMAMMAMEMCESISVYATAGSDILRTHRTELVPPRRGFGLGAEINKAARSLGGGGIFTRQCLEYIKTQEHGAVDRIVVFSDSQDCDWPGKQTPAPFGNYNYIVDVSAHSRGINYDGLWTAEISGWSEHFLAYIAALEGLSLPEQEQL